MKLAEAGRSSESRSCSTRWRLEIESVTRNALVFVKKTAPPSWMLRRVLSWGTRSDALR